MKRGLVVLLATIIFLCFLSSCDNSKTSEVCEHNWSRIENVNEYTAMEKCSICSVTRIFTDSDNIHYSGTETGFRILYYNYGALGGVSYKNINNSDLGYAILDCLSNLEETEQEVPFISNKLVDTSSKSLPIERGTMWIECGSDGLYRLNPDMSQICKLEKHLGKGKVLIMTDTLKELLKQAWNYYPNDYWSGEYKNGKITLEQIYKSNSAVEYVTVENIYIENDRDSKNNKITLRIKASESKTVKTNFMSLQSYDNFGTIESKEVELVKGEYTSLEFTFIGYNVCYDLSISIDNTRISFKIHAGE